MRKITLGLLTIVALLGTNTTYAQTIGGALNKVKNTAKDVKSTKKEVESTANEFKRDKKNSKGSTPTTNTSSSGAKSTTGNTVKTSSEKRNGEPQLAFIKDLDKPEETTAFNANDPLFFVFDYGMDLQDFFDKYIVTEKSFEWILSIKMENGAEIYKVSDNVQRYPVKETVPIIEFLQVGEKYMNQDFKALATDFPEAVLKYLAQGNKYNLSYSFTIKKDLVSPPSYEKSGTFSYDYRVSDRSVLVQHLSGYAAKQYDVKTSDVNYSAIHKKNIGKIRFGKGSPNANLQDESKFVTSLDLSSPSFFNVYLEEPMRNTDVRNTRIREAGAFIRKYYINNQLIAAYSDELEPEEYKNNAVYSDVLVPASHGDFSNNEMRVGVLAHVFSSLSPGTYKFKVEYVMVKSTIKPNTSGSAATEYESQEFTIASGEVDVKIDAAALANYTKNYGRPKFNKGVLEDSKLNQQVTDLIKRTDKREPVYVYAVDNWKIIRGALDRVIAREARCYYIFKNSSGRCEMVDLIIHQDFDGSKYGAPKYHHSTFAPPFKYVVCDNY